MNTKESNEYAIRNILQCIDNAAIYCTYITDPSLFWELKGLIERFRDRVEKKINVNF